MDSAWLFSIYTCLNFVFPKIQFPSILTEVFLISGGFWNLMKRHLICVFSVGFFFNKISVFPEKKLQRDLCLCPKSRWMQLDRGTVFLRTWCRVVLITSLSLMLRREGPPISRGVCWHLCLSESMRVHATVASAKKGVKASCLSSFLLNPCLCLRLCLCLRTVLQNRCDHLDQFHQQTDFSYNICVAHVFSILFLPFFQMFLLRTE